MSKSREAIAALQGRYNLDLSFKPTPGFIRAEAVLGTAGSYTFDFVKSATTVSVNERKISIADAICVTDIGIYTYKIPDGGEVSTGQLQTWPNPNVFTGTNEARNLNALYNGTMTITDSNTKYIEGDQLLKYLRVPAIQQGTTTAAYINSTPANAEFTIARDEWSGFNYGMKPLEPFFVLSGDAKFDVTINLPSGAPTLAGTSSTNYLVVILQGYIASNVNTRR